MNSQLTSSHIVLRTTAIVFSLLVFANAAHADIFQWEYINPADPSQGKRQSTTLAPNGAGVDAAPGAQLYYRDLARAYLIGADLQYASAVGTNLTDAALNQSNLTNANFPAAILTDADFTNAAVKGATFHKNYYWSLGGGLMGTGITPAQIYSTASYQERDLRGIGLRENDLTGANFTGQIITAADFAGAILTDADFTDAEISAATFHKEACYACPWGTGITPSQLYATASYKKRDLSGVGFWYHDFTGGNFAGQELTQADFYAATLTDADFTRADVRGAHFEVNNNCVPTYGCNPIGTGLSLEQLYSTVSYQAKDLSGIGLHSNRLSGGDFAGQNLTYADFSGAGLTNADFTGADVRGARLGSTGTSNVIEGIQLAQLYTTASYQAHDLSGIDLSAANLAGADFTGQNLTNASFYRASLAGADFTGAVVRGVSFGRLTAGLSGWRFGSGISLAQLQSTASYQAKDLSGIKLQGNFLAGANFAGQYLTNAYFYEAILTGADFTAADARGATGLNLESSATTASMIRPDGLISGLNLANGEMLVVRDYDGDPRYAEPPMPITVDQHIAMGPGGTLRMVFEADAWDSTISFAPGIPVTLGGTLELTFADDVNLASQVGRTFDLFNWTGVSPTGAFAISSPYAWDLSNLYTTGEVTLTAVPEPSISVLIAAALTIFPPRRWRRSGKPITTL